MSYLKLIRYPNLLIIILTQYLLRYCIIQPFLSGTGYNILISNLDFFLLVLSTVFIAAAGYAINDYFDLQSDQVNRPGSLILGTKIPAKKAIILHWIFNVLGVIIGLYLGWKTHSVLIAAINFITSVALWFYSVVLKKMPLTGNVLVSLLSALVLYFPWIFTLKMLKGFHPAEEVYGLQYQVANVMVECFASFAFLANLFREIVKDAEDIEGDAVRRCQTLPIIMGVKKIRIVLIVVLLIIFAQLVLFQLIFSQVKLTAAFRYFSFVLQPFLFILIYFTWISGVKKDFTRLSLLAKLLMLAGIIGMVFIAL